MENIENNLSKYEIEILSKRYGSCPYCKQPFTDFDWCRNCNSKRFQQRFNKWTSGNVFIDKFIQDAQLKARNYQEIIEWIHYNRLCDIKFLAQGGFSTIYKAIWLDGYIDNWDIIKKQWIRSEHKDVVLKSLNNSSNINEDFLIEWKYYLNFVYSAENDLSCSIKIHGITQDPKTLNYMIVMEYVDLGSLRSNLMTKKYNPNDKYENLYYITRSLITLHKCNLIHGDLHSGNLLLYSDRYAYISDLGLSQPVDKPISKYDEVYGVLPYIAPEVLRGKPYTKAADIYSFGIIMWEMTSGVSAFNNVSHDFNLSLNICQGLRPKIVEGIDSEYSELMKRCWDSDPNKRPEAEELFEYFSRWKKKYPFIQHRRISVPENELTVQNHQLSCYSSRKFDYSAKLNDMLSDQEELSSQIMINDVHDDILLLSESLENFKISSSRIDSVQESKDGEN